MIKHKIKLSYKLQFVVIFSFIISVLFFYVFFVNRYHALDLYMGGDYGVKATAQQIREMQQTVTTKKISKKDKKAIRDLMKAYTGLSMTLYSENDEYIADHILSEDSLSISTSSFWLEIYYPEVEDFTLDFYDGTCYLVVQSFQGMQVMMIYLITVSGISLILFFGLIMHFVRKKMRTVVLLEHEMKLIENGDLTHEIKAKGNDEITSLAWQLNHLREALQENMEKEQDARKANEELITTMSHDLRTPLTSLLGYLDILQMGIYKNEEDRDSYVVKSKQKAEQIKHLSDRLFTHFFVIAQDDDLMLERVSIDHIKEALHNCKEELESAGFQVRMVQDEQHGEIMGETGLIGRILDNIFSNLVKYADKQNIAMRVCVEEQFMIEVANSKRQQTFKEESTCIGLKSIEKMMKQVNGSMLITESETDFTIKLCFPLIENEEEILS